MTFRSRITILSFVVIALAIGSFYSFRSRVPQLIPDVVVPLPSPLPASAREGFKLLPIKNTAFKSGERLHFNIIYKGVTVGHSTIEITDGPLVEGKPTLKYVSKVESTSFFDNFFKVRDENISIVDKASLFSLSFDQNLREGHYRAVRHYVFDYKNRKATSEEKKKGKIKTNEGALSEPLYDVLSALYFTRTRELTPGRNLSLSIYRDNGGKTLPVKIGPALKTQKTPFGIFACLRVEPQIQGDSIFKAKEAALVVWMTNDEHKLPVFIEATASFGVVRVKLTNWEK